MHHGGPLIRAELPGNQCVVAPGDSGGPAYSYRGGEVIGRGTISAGFRGTATCPGQFPDEGTNTVFYAPLLRPPGDPQVGSLQFGGVDILT